MAFTVLVLVAILIGGMVEIIPTVMTSQQIPGQMAEVTALQNEDGVYRFMQEPYSPLEVEGRDIYVREGCYTCHSQMVRPFRHETLRYGEFSRASEFIYDTPFQWGSKRTGPDLHRVGGRYPNQWHYMHMMDPRDISSGSIMPDYAFMKDKSVDLNKIAGKMSVLRTIGVPYSDEQIETAAAVALSQGELIAKDLSEARIEIEPDSEMAAIIAYLQRLGRGPQEVK
jgi:cytochrome c oxidase cbb3-type subunit I/II